MEGVIDKKSYAFSLEIIELYKSLSFEKKEYVLANQILRSGTSIGANIREASQAQSKRDYLSKVNIALKEAVETEYWIQLLRDSNYLDVNSAKRLLSKCTEIIRILVSIIKTLKQNLNIE